MAKDALEQPYSRQILLVTFGVVQLGIQLFIIQVCALKLVVLRVKATMCCPQTKEISYYLSLSCPSTKCALLHHRNIAFGDFCEGRLTKGQSRCGFMMVLLAAWPGVLVYVVAIQMHPPSLFLWQLGTWAYHTLAMACNGM